MPRPRRSHRGRSRRAPATNAGSAFGISIRSKPHAELARPLLRLVVDVPADLQMVGDEADRTDEHVARSRGRARSARWSRMSGPSHGSPVGDSLWNENDQSSTPAASATSRDVSSSWSRYGSPSSRMRAGSECAVKTTCARCPRMRSARKAIEPGVVVPALDERGAGAPGDGLVELVAVAGDRERAVVRREHEADECARAGGERRSDGVRDARRPVLHAGVDRQAELGLERGPRRLGDRVQRVRVLDPEAAVAVDEIVEVLGRDRPAAADVRVVGRDVGDPLRRAVGHQDDGGVAHRPDASPDTRVDRRLLDELGEPRDRSGRCPAGRRARG